MNSVFKRNFHFFVLSFFAIIIFAGCDLVKPEWQVEKSSSSSDYTNSVLYDVNGDIVVTADSFTRQENSTKESFLVVKYDNSGNFIWDYKYEGNSSRIFAVDSDNYGNIFIAAASEKGGVLVKLYPDGSKAWKLDNLDIGWITGGLKAFGNNIYFACNSLYSIDNQSGEISWSESNDLRVTDLDIDDNGNIYLAGYDFMASYDNTGKLKWKNEFDQSSGMVSFAFGSDNTIFASLYLSQNEVELQKIEKDTGKIIAAVTESGSKIWAPKVECDGAGNVILAFSCDNTNNGRKIFKFNSFLTKKWENSYESGAENMDLSDLAVASNGDIYITGGNKSSKIDSNGKKIVTITSGSVYTNNYLVLNSDQSKICLGSSEAHINNKNITLAQYDTN